MTNKNIGTSLALAYMLFCSCKRHPEPINSVGDKDIHVQVARIKEEHDAAGELNYAVRLIPDKKLLGDKNNQLNTALWYHMDSCFYITAGNRKIYAVLTQPIANGVASAYEYYLSFDIEGSPPDKMNFVYQDRYLNHKKYSIMLSN